jgi:Ca-activated chloride channel family protein
MKITIALIFILSMFIEVATAQIAEPLAEVGQSNYIKGDFQEAANSFGSAFEQSPNDASLAYNLANSQYRLGQFDQALQTYNQAVTISQDSKLKQKAYYNAGNSLFNLGKVDQAIDSYKKALELNPDDIDAKFNLEFAREQLKKNQQNSQDKNDKNKSDSKDQQDSKDKDPSKDSESDEENKDDKNSQQNEGSPSQKKSDSNNQNADPPEDPPEENSMNAKQEQEKADSEAAASQAKQPEGLSKEQAEQWLLSINENLKKYGQMQASKLRPSPGYNGKDW